MTDTHTYKQRLQIVICMRHKTYYSLSYVF